jgi:GDP-4-dehydro-6-deoxy-D-mannose reductase
MTQSALITGAAGFIGRHIAAFLQGRGIAVYGLDRVAGVLPGDLYACWYQGDVADAEWILSTVRTVRPDYVFHFAALLETDSLSELLAVNAIGTQCLLDAIAVACPESVVLVPGSSAEYGLAYAQELPIREENTLRPLSVYGVSKIAQGCIAARYAYRHGMRIIRTRTFNMTGPGEPETLVCSAFAKQIVQIKMGLRPAFMEVGNLETSRDFIDVRDAIRAYALAAEMGEPGEVYNICSGSSVPIRTILQTLMELAGIEVQVRQRSLREVEWDVPNQVGAPTKFRNLTGWTPSLTLRESLRDLLADWNIRMTAK